MAHYNELIQDEPSETDSVLQDIYFVLNPEEDLEDRLSLAEDSAKYFNAHSFESQIMLYTALQEFILNADLDEDQVERLQWAMENPLTVEEIEAEAEAEAEAE